MNYTQYKTASKQLDEINCEVCDICEEVQEIKDKLRNTYLPSPVTQTQLHAIKKAYLDVTYGVADSFETLTDCICSATDFFVEEEDILQYASRIIELNDTKQIRSKDVELLKALKKVFEALLWNTNNSNAFALRIIDKIHNGEYGSSEGVIVQFEDVIKRIAENVDK